MSDAEKILQERFARGEITEGDFLRQIEVLRANHVAQTPQQTVNISGAVENGVFVGILAAVFVLVFVGWLFGSIWLNSNG